MPKTTIISRLIDLVNFLRSDRKYDSAALAEMLSVSRRTIFRDIKRLQDAGLTIHFDPTFRAYWMNPDQAFPVRKFRNEELLNLVLSSEFGNPNGGIPCVSSSYISGAKLASILRQSASFAGERLIGKVQVHSHQFPLISEEQKGFFEDAKEAMRTGCKVRVTYHNVDHTEVTRTLLSPYCAVHRSGAWRLVGRSSFHRAVRTIPLHRLMSLELTGDRYEIPPRFSSHDYYQHSWNVDRSPHKQIEVAIVFTGKAAFEIREVRWNPTQTILNLSGDAILFRVNVYGVEEIARWILQFGESAHVIEPPQLVDLMKDSIRSMAEVYEIKFGRAAKKERRSA